MDKLLFNTLHTRLYLTTLDIGLGINYLREYRIFSIKLLIFEFQIAF